MWPQNTYIEITSGFKYILFAYMDPEGKSPMPNIGALVAVATYAIFGAPSCNYRTYNGPPTPYSNYKAPVLNVSALLAEEPGR